MIPTPTLSAFIVERGHLLAEAVAELGAQFALPAECVHLSVRPALCAAQGDLAELDELLHESLPDLDGGPDDAPTGGLPGNLSGDPSGAPGRGLAGPPCGGAFGAGSPAFRLRVRGGGRCRRQSCAIRCPRRIA
ncbi:hypothetical protein ACR4XJ_11090 [Nitratidesulfovibrio sp. D1]|uniref:hypothetical protein n=1 Tax=Nitratidesulfovibrio sp. D1 TaxID=3440151 RepID=UPI003EBB5475